MDYNVTTRSEFLALVWDLRDRAYDNPDPWRRVDAQSVFQALAETIEAEAANGAPNSPSWAELAGLLLQAMDRAEGFASPA